MVNDIGDSVLPITVRGAGHSDRRFSIHMSDVSLGGRTPFPVLTSAESGRNRLQRFVIRIRRRSSKSFRDDHLRNGTVPENAQSLRSLRQMRQLRSIS